MLLDVVSEILRCRAEDVAATALLHFSPRLGDEIALLHLTLMQEVKARLLVPSRLLECLVRRLLVARVHHLHVRSNLIIVNSCHNLHFVDAPVLMVQLRLIAGEGHVSHATYAGVGHLQRADLPICESNRSQGPLLCTIQLPLPCRGSIVVLDRSS